jgi:hypothetical protein
MYLCYTIHNFAFGPPPRSARRRVQPAAAFGPPPRSARRRVQPPAFFAGQPSFTNAATMVSR